MPGSIFYLLLFLISCVSPLALSPLVALLEFPEPTGPQVFPGDEKAALVCHHAALTAGVVVVIRAHEQVLPARFDFRTLARHVFSANPQELVSSADALSALLIHGDDVDGELPPFACLVSLQHVNLDHCGEEQIERFLSSFNYFGLTSMSKTLCPGITDISLEEKKTKSQMF